MMALFPGYCPVTGVMYLAIASLIEAHLGQERPGSFFDACQVGRQGWTLTRIGG